MSATRDQIIETTCALLELQGYHATGLNQIVKESGSPKGSLYHYFPGGKEELTEEALRRVGNVVLDRIRTNLAVVDDPAAAIRRFIRMLADAVERSGFQSGGPITTVAMETASTNDRLRLVCEDIYNSWIAAFAEKLQAGGLTAAEADKQAQVVIAALEGGIILSRTRRSADVLRHVADVLGNSLGAG